MPTSEEKADYYRKFPSPAEEKLWEQLRDRKLGSRFDFKVSLHGRIMDFYCEGAKLAVQVGYARSPRQEDGRFEFRHGIRVIRFTDRQVMTKLWEVLETIRQALRGHRVGATYSQAALGYLVNDGMRRGLEQKQALKEAYRLIKNG